MNRAIKRHPYRLLNKSHQYRFIATILIYHAIIIALLAVFLFLPDIIRMQDSSLSLEARTIAADKILTLHSKVWPVIFLVLCLIGLHSFRRFLQVIGPVYRFTIAFKEIGDGNLNYQIKLRDGDYFTEEADIFNKMLHTINGKIGKIQKKGQDALQLLNNIDTDKKEFDGQVESGHKSISCLRQNLNELITTANYFQTEQDI